MILDKRHPRYLSLLYREKLIEGYFMGIVAIAGLIAHGRGETFDYLLGEKTHEETIEAIKAGAALLLLAKHPVISVNGNFAILAGKEIIELSKILNAKIEVNLFYRSKKRIEKIKRYLLNLGAEEVLGDKDLVEIPTIRSERRRVSKRGIYKADVVLVAIEDGDRTEELIKLGKKVIAIDLNPLSRTARYATITIVDNVTRAMPILLNYVKKLRTMKRSELKEIVKKFNNTTYLKKMEKKIRTSFKIR